MIGRSSGEMFQIGDTVDVRLLEVTPIKGGLRLEMVSDGREDTTNKKRKPPVKSNAKKRKFHR
jgi:ribonuclease R